jgi:hypothetical protein
MSKIYFVHAATNAGVPVVKASRATIGEALRRADFELSGGAAFVWIVDSDGRLVLPADRIKARLGRSVPARDVAPADRAAATAPAGATAEAPEPQQPSADGAGRPEGFRSSTAEP